MITAELKRFAHTSDGVFGVLLINSVPLVLTLEPVWKQNQNFMSCIPPDPKGEWRYECERRMSDRWGTTFEVMNVSHRSDILFHVGNTSADTEGCILVGLQLGSLGSKTAILKSSAAQLTFMKRMDGVVGFKMKVRWM